MIRANHRAFHVWFFNQYSRWMMRYHFRKVLFQNEMASPGTPVMMIGNHFSWWDGFIACYINQKVFRKKFHIMMLEEQLRPRMFLNKAGAYSIRKGSRSLAESIAYTVELLKDDNHLVVLYPQGEFSSVYQQEFVFEKGIGSIAMRSVNGFSLVFYAALVDYFSNRRPTLYLYLAEAPGELARDHLALQGAYNTFYKKCIHQQKPDKWRS